MTASLKAKIIMKNRMGIYNHSNKVWNDYRWQKNFICNEKNAHRTNTNNICMALQEQTLDPKKTHFVDRDILLKGNDKDTTTSADLGLTLIYENICRLIKDTPNSVLESNPLNETLLIHRKAHLFYTIFDIEQSSSRIILGFYFPIIKHYHSICLDKEMSKEEFNEIRRDIVRFFTLLLSPVDLFVEGNILFDATQLSSRQPLIDLSKEAKGDYYENPNVISAYLSLTPTNPVKQSLEMSLDKLIGSLLITFNGSEYDLFILSKILFYNANIESNSYTSLNKIKTDLESENPSECIEQCYVLSKNIIESPYIPKNNNYNKGFPFSRALTRSLIHFDLGAFAKNASVYQNLYVNKVNIFVKEKFVGMPPLEVLPLSEPINYDTFITEKNYDFVILYNFNDTYYTWKSLYNMPTAITHLNSRFLFFECFELKSVNFATSLNTPDPRLGIQYITTQLGVNYNSVTIQNKININNLTFKDLIYLNEYPLSRPLYEAAFDGVLYSKTNKTELKNNTLTICGTNITLGFGGIHSNSWSDITESAADLNGKNDNPIKSDIIIASEDTMIFDLDVASFYVVIILQLLKKVNDLFKYEFFHKMIQLRNSLKKEKNPLQLVYKIIILSVTGQFNLEKSPVYDPLMYFSMTANGQLIITEILLSLEKEGLIKKLIACNTDGFTVEVLKTKVDDFKNHIKKYEEEFSIEFDTFDEIKSILLLNVNKYIILYKNGKTKQRGFPLGDFEIKEKVLTSVLSELKTNRIDLDILWVHFNKVWSEIVNDKTLTKELLSYKSYGGEKKIFFLSYNPQSFAGILVGGSAFYRNDVNILPIEEYSFQRNLFENYMLKREITLSKEYSISKVSYFKIIFNELQNADLTVDKTIDPQNQFQNHDNLNDFETCLVETYPIVKAAKYFSERNIVVFPKSINKKSFRGFKEPKEVKASEINSYCEKLIKNPLLFTKAAALTIDATSSFSKVIVLDVDNPKEVWDGSLFKTQGMVNLFRRALETNSLIVSSCSREQMERFKILIMLTDGDQFNKFTEIKNKFTAIFKENNLPFALEDRASVIGMNMTPWELKPFYSNIITKTEPLNMTVSELEKIITIQSTPIMEDITKILQDILRIRLIPPSIFDEKVENGKTKSSYNYSSTPDSLDLTLLNQQRNALQLAYQEAEIICNKFLTDTYYYSMDSVDLIEDTLNNRFNIMNKIVEVEIQKVKEPINIKKIKTDAKQLEIIKANQSFKEMEQLELKTILTYRENPISKTITFSWNNLLCDYINNFLKKLTEKENLNFKLKKIEYYHQNGDEVTLDISANDEYSQLLYEILPENTLIKNFHFSSPCRYKQDGDPRVVGMIITNKWNIAINCFHESCKTQGLYQKLAVDESSIFLILYLLSDRGPFEVEKGSIYDYLIKKNP